MLGKYVWQVLFLVFLATASFATPSSGPSWHDDVLHDRTRLRKMRLESGEESSVTFANDTTYEKLDCVGFNPSLNLLSATIEVKLPYGFLGGPCTKGSYEYVRFWVNYGSGWNHIGMTMVNITATSAFLDRWAFSLTPDGVPHTVTFGCKSLWV